MRSDNFRILAAGAFLVAAAAGFYFFTRSPAAQEAIVDLRGKSQISVVLTDNGYEPKAFRISPNTTVVFSTTRSHDFWPASNPHPQHTIYPAFDPKVPVEADKTWSFVFDQPGEWGFHDHIRSYFTGTVYVSE